MNAFFSTLEQMMVGGSDDPRDCPMLRFPPSRLLTQRAFFEGVLIMASVGRGKTTLARTLCRTLLRDHFGGLVLTVKSSQVDEFLTLMRLEDREQDCVLLGPGHANCFNPLAHETDANEATALVMELSEVLASQASDGRKDEVFWQQQLAIILRHLFTLCWVQHERLDLRAAAELLDSRANTAAQLHDPSWRRSSLLWTAIIKARAQSPLPESVRLACEYFEAVFLAHGDRLQGSVAAMAGGVLDYLRRPPLSELFGGRSTFSMADILNAGKVCIVAMPALDSFDGRIANAIMQYSFCRAATRLKPRLNPAFLLADECQEMITKELMRKLAVLREFKVATILATQNLAVLDDKVGQTAREALCGLMATKIFGGQGDAATRKWASEQIGKAKTTVRTRTTGHGGGKSSASTSVQQVWDYRVDPSLFDKLKPGETICLRDGHWWRARWHEHDPGSDGTVAIL